MIKFPEHECDLTSRHLARWSLKSTRQDGGELREYAIARHQSLVDTFGSDLAGLVEVYADICPHEFLRQITTLITKPIKMKAVGFEMPFEFRIAQHSSIPYVLCSLHYGLSTNGAIYELVIDDGILSARYCSGVSMLWPLDVDAFMKVYIAAARRAHFTGPGKMERFGNRISQAWAHTFKK